MTERMSLSPYLLNLFIEEANQIMMEKTKGINTNGKRKHCIGIRQYCRTDWFGKGNKQWVTNIVLLS